MIPPEVFLGAFSTFTIKDPRDTKGKKKIAPGRNLFSLLLCGEVFISLGKGSIL
jgi:hypothetical protein